MPSTTTMHIFSYLFVLLSLFALAHSAVTVSIGINVQHPSLNNHPKANITRPEDTWNLMYVGLYSLSDIKVSAMKFAMQYINSQYEILPNTKLELYGYNSKQVQAQTISAAFAGYAGFNIMGFIGAESYEDCSTLQYIAGAYYVPHINPTVTESALSDPQTFRSIANIIPSAIEQRMAVLALMKKLGIQGALVITTNNAYGREFAEMNYFEEAVNLNMTFVNIVIDTNQSDFDQKLEIVKSQLHYYRYVIMHCTSTTGFRFLQKLGDAGLIGPDYLYIITHSMSVAIQEKPSYANYVPYLDGAIGVTARYSALGAFPQAMRQAWASASPTEFAGAGSNMQSAWFAFDAVYAFALALDNLLKNGHTTASISGEAYYNSIMNLSFVGATGNVAFNSSSASRLAGLWDIVNFINVDNVTLNYTYRAIADGKSTNLRTEISDFTFYGGSTTIPPPYVEPVVPRKTRDYIPALSAALGAIVGLAILATLFGTVLLFMYWPSFSRHGSFYSLLILSGIFLSLGAALTLLPKPTDGLCLAFPWLLGTGFSLVFGCLFIKTWTLYKVWRDAENFKKTNLSPYTILKGIALNLVLEIVVLVLWSGLDRPKAVYHEMVDGYWMLTCKTEKPTFWAIFIGIKGLWLVFGSVLSIISRRIAVEYNQSRSISYAIYNIFGLLLIGIPLAITLEDIPGGRVIIEVAVIVIAFTFTEISLFFKVWYRIFVPVTDDIIAGISVGSPRHTSGTGTGTGSAHWSSQSRSGSGSSGGLAPRSSPQNSAHSKNSQGSKDSSDSASHSMQL